VAVTALWQWLLARLAGRPSVRERHEQMAEAARRKAEKAGLLYDAYPAPAHNPRMRLLVAYGRVMETVDLDGYSLHEINVDAPRWRRELGPRIAQARARAKQRYAADVIARGERAYERAVAKEERDKARE
jgi:hypothetical protein